jgi:hypothetical protein
MNNNLSTNEISFFKINRSSTQNDHEDSRNTTLIKPADYFFFLVINKTPESKICLRAGMRNVLCKDIKNASMSKYVLPECHSSAGL